MKMKTRKDWLITLISGAVATAAILLLAFPGSALADEGTMYSGKWSLTVSAGLEAEVSGKAHGAAEGIVLDLPTNVRARSLNHIYGNMTKARLALGYSLSDRSEILAIYSYGKGSSRLTQVGDVAGLPLYADFDDYRTNALELGYRFYITPESKLKTYAGVSAGAVWIDEINATLTVPDAGVILPDVGFYKKTTAFTGGVDLGLKYSFNDVFDLGFETGIHYNGRPSQNEGLAGTGLETINDYGSRYYMPLIVTGTFNF